MKEVEFPHKFVVSDNVSCCKKKKNQFWVPHQMILCVTNEIHILFHYNRYIRKQALECYKKYQS